MATRREAGKIAQHNGEKYENILLTDFLAKGQTYANIVNYICQTYGVKESDHIFNLFDYKKNGKNNKVPSVLRLKTTSKSDLLLIVKNLMSGQEVRFGISAKMSPGSYQIQICPFHIFWEYAKLNLKINPNNEDVVVLAFKKFFGIDGNNPLLLESSEKISFMRSNRIALKVKNSEKEKFHPKYYFFELDTSEQMAINEFLKNNLKEIYEFCYKRGSCSESDNFADILIYNNKPFTETNILDISIRSIDDYILELLDEVKDKTEFGAQKGNINLGKVKLQMKASGKGTSYTAMQFKG